MTRIVEMSRERARGSLASVLPCSEGRSEGRAVPHDTSPGGADGARRSGPSGLLPGEVGFPGRVRRALREEPPAGAAGQKEAGRITAVRTYVPTYHGDGRADWTFAVAITYKDTAAMTGPSDEAAIVRRLYPGPGHFQEGRTAPLRDSRRALGRAAERAEPPSSLAGEERP